ncbi:UDP-glucose 4-epimerase GalE [Candidatus Saccharibacteria bacterium]|nr:UDP-glucose 4-epimerase GalE [Candidatus Saccharibacteria bacterium]
MKVLLTGGAGYIGSHILVELFGAGHSPVVVDNLSNSSKESIKRVAEIAGKTAKFYLADVRDTKKLEQIFKTEKPEAVIHLAGLKSVGESVTNPIEYYDNNINSTLILLKAMQKFGVTKLIFSSSATVYGDPSELPLTEESDVGLGIPNPYGWSKYMQEQVLRDVSTANPEMEITLLRYFNPIGAHESGLIGEDPNGIPNNLLPYVSQVAVGKLKRLSVFGDDYDTPDGTGVRDYLHVVDLAKGHVAALNCMKAGVDTYNLGTGVGVSVKDVIKAYSRVTGKNIPHKIVPRRVGDVASCYASAKKAKKLLKWEAKRGLVEACVDSYYWQSKNPNGYKK